MARVNDVPTRGTYFEVISKTSPPKTIRRDIFRGRACSMSSSNRKKIARRYGGQYLKDIREGRHKLLVLSNFRNVGWRYS